MSAPLHQRDGGADVDTGARRACLADACMQGRAPCPCPDACETCAFESGSRLTPGAVLRDLAIVLAVFLAIFLIQYGVL